MSATRNILILVKTQGLTEAQTAIKGVGTASGQATKAANGLGSAWTKQQASALKLKAGVTNLDKSEKSATGTTTKFGAAADTAGKKTGGLAAKFQGNKGAIFAFVGMASAGMEAIGMFGMYQSAADKLSQAQAKVNAMQEAGITDTAEYKRATDDVAEAQRGYNFILRNVAMSFGDLVPFTLLAINAIVKMRDTVAGSKGAMDAATQATTGLGNAANTTSSGGITNLFNRLGQVVTGTKNYDTGIKTATTTTNTFATGALKSLDTGFVTTNTRVQDATRFIGTGNQGLVGGITGLTTEMDKNTRQGTRFQDFFKKLGDGIKNLPNTFKSIGTGIASFFTNFGTNITKFGGMLKTAGTAAMTFGRTMLMALASNPITAAIALISGAVLALITDFGGVRTAVNNAGVALGNAVPPLKGLLTAIGSAANGAMDYVAGMMGVETSSEKAAKKAEALGKVLNDPLVKSLQNFVHVGKELEFLDEVSMKFDNLRKEIDKVGDSGLNTITITNQFDTAIATLGTKSENTQKQIDIFNQTVETLGKSSIDAEEKERLLTIALNAVLNAAGQSVVEGKNLIQTQQQQAQAAADAADAANGLTARQKEQIGQLQNLNFELEDDNRILGEHGKKLEENRQKVEGWLRDMNMLTTATEAQKSSLVSLAPALGTIGEHIDLTGGKTANLSTILDSMVAKQAEVEAGARQLWGVMAQEINQVGEDAFPRIEKALEILKEWQPALYDEVKKLYDGWIEASDSTTGHIYLANEAEAEQAKAVESSSESIAEKAKELQIYEKIQGLSLQNQKNAIKITEDQTKAENESILTLQKLAHARGLDLSHIQKTSDELLKHIATNNKVVVSIDDVNAATGQLLDARRNDAQEAEIQRQAQEKLMTTLGRVPPVLGMTGKGLEQVNKLYDDTANAVGIAADEIGIWIAQLDKEQAVETETLKLLQDYAKQHGIVIPAEIAKDIEKTKEFIEVVQGVGPAAKKAADEAKKAFDDMVGKTKSALEGVISDALGEDGDNVKKAIKGIKKLGLEMDSLTAKQHIINIFLNDENFENDLMSLGETMIAAFGRMENFTKQEAQVIGESFISGIVQEVGSKAPEVAATVEQIWAEVQATSKPEETGDQMLGRLIQRLQNVGGLNAAGVGMGSAVTQGTQQGLSGLTGAINPQLQQGLQAIFGQNTNFSTAGQQLGTATSSGVGTGLQNGASTVQNATLAGINNPITNTVGQVPGQAGTALAPIEGIFSQAFLNASIAATQHINKLVDVVNSGIMRINTTATTYLGLAATQFDTFWQKVNEAIGKTDQKIKTFDTNTKNSFTNVNRTISGGMSAIDAFYKAWDKALGQADQKLKTFANNAKSSFDKVGQSADDARKKVDALKKSIDALKSKSITIHVGLSGPGARFVRHGGSGLNIPSESGMSYAASGKTWIQKTPKTIGNLHVSETFPEIISVIPLDPNEKNSPFHNNNNNKLDVPLNVPAPTQIQMPIGGATTTTGGGGSSNNITGNIYVTVKTQSGKVLAQEIQPFLLDNYSGVT